MTVPLPFQQAVAEGHDALGPALALLAHPDPLVVNQALYTLLGLPDLGHIEHLTRILIDPTRTELNRRLATDALLAVVARSDPGTALHAVVAVRSGMREHLQRDPDLDARLTAAIRPQWGPAAIDLLIEDVVSPEISVRVAALRSLADGYGHVAESPAFDVLDRRLVDDGARGCHGPTEERCAAIAVLADAASPAAAERLLQIALDDGIPVARESALVALGAVEHPRAFELLTAAVDDADHRLRFAAVRGLGALARHGDSRALPALRARHSGLDPVRERENDRIWGSAYDNNEIAIQLDELITEIVDELTDRPRPS